MLRINGLVVNTPVHAHTFRAGPSTLRAYTAGTSETAPWVVLLNSMGADVRMWTPQIEMLSRNFRILCPDYRGHGGSDTPPQDWSLDGLANDVYAAMCEFDIESAHVVGTSLGGIIGMKLATEKAPQVRSLVVCSALARIEPVMRAEWLRRIEELRRDGAESVVAPTLARWFTAGFAQREPDIAHEVRDMLRGTSTEGYARSIQAFLDLDLISVLGSISIPCLFMVGEKDPASTPAIMSALHKNVPGSSLAVIASAAHLPSLEQPAEVNRFLAQFLASAQ